MNKARFLLASPMALAIMGAPAVFAQEQAAPQSAGSETTENIVVTAQFRRQRLQDTPLAITAVTGE